MRKRKICFRFSGKGEIEVLIASMARWDEQLKGLIMLERRCLTLKEEVEHLPWGGGGGRGEPDFFILISNSGPQ